MSHFNLTRVIKIQNYTCYRRIYQYLSYLQADIIVCEADKTLDLTKDDESNKVLHAAGKEIQVCHHKILMFVCSKPLQDY